MAKRALKRHKQDAERREKFDKKADKELRAFFRKILADNFERVENISDDEWAAAVAQDEEEL